MAKFLLDSADINEIEKWKLYINGITTNPSLLEKAGITPMELYGKLKKLGFKQNFLMFVQVADLPVHKNLIPSAPAPNGPKVIYKIPLVKEQYHFIKTLKMQNEVCGTMTYDIIQLQAAINLNADYSIVLCHKNEDKMFPYNAYSLVKENNKKIKLIGASFRSKEEVAEAIYAGVDYVTVPPSVMEECFFNGQAQKDYDNTYK